MSTPRRRARPVARATVVLGLALLASIALLVVQLVRWQNQEERTRLHRTAQNLRTIFDLHMRGEAEFFAVAASVVRRAGNDVALRQTLEGFQASQPQIVRLALVEHDRLVVASAANASRVSDATLMDAASEARLLGRPGLPHLSEPFACAGAKCFALVQPAAGEAGASAAIVAVYSVQGWLAHFGSRVVENVGIRVICKDGIVLAELPVAGAGRPRLVEVVPTGGVMGRDTTLELAAFPARARTNVIGLGLLSALIAIGLVVSGGALVWQQRERRRVDLELRGVFASLAEGVIVVAPDGRIRESNEAAQRILGLDQAALAERPLGDLRWRLVSTDGQSIEAGTLLRQLQERLGAAGTLAGLQRDDGSLRWLSFRPQPLASAAGEKALGTVVCFSDVTESRRADELMRQAIRVARIGVYDHDQLTDTIYWSPELRATFGWGADEAHGLPDLLEQVHPEDRESVVAAVRRAHDPSGDGAFAVDYRFLRGDGSVRWHSVRGQTFFAGEDGGRRPIRSVGAVLDITERQQAEIALRASQERLVELVRQLESKTAVLASVASCEERFIAGQPAASVFGELLDAARRLTGSDLGFVAVAEPESEGSGQLRAAAFSGPVWNEASRGLLENLGGVLDFRGLGALFGEVQRGRVVLVDDVASDPRAAPLPLGHPPVRSFLGIPLCHSAEMVGMIGLGNREGGYDQELVAGLGPLLTTAATLIEATRSARMRDEAEAELSRMLEQALRTERDLRLYEAAVQATANAIVLTERSGRIVWVNRAFCELSGYSVEEAVGQTPRLLRSGVQSQGLYASLWETILAGRTWSGDIVNRRKDGTLYVEEMTITPLRDASGAVTHFVAVQQDVGWRREAEARLRATAEEWRVTFDALDTAVLLLDASQRVIRLNQPAADLLGSDWHACLGLVPWEHSRREPWTTAGEMILGGTTEACQVTDELGRVFALSTRALGAQAEGAPHVVLALRDVTRVAELQESVRRSETLAAMGRLVGGVAHEVRNPLFAMSVNIDALATVFLDDPEVAEILKALRHERDRISRLMEELLHYGRPAAVTLSIKPLGPVLEASLASVAPLATAQGVRLRRVGDVTGGILMNAGRLEEVFTNLLENACQHSPPGSEVVVEVDTIGTPRGPRACIRVHDAGPGFPADVLPRLFEPFFTRRKGGTGLGLAIAERFVSEHGGRVHASNAEDGGGILTVELPLAQAAAA